MGSDSNRLRRKWQDYSGENASTAEKNFYDTFKILFEGSEYQIKSKPNEFRNIYVDYPLKEKDLLEIYTPTIQIKRHGVFPDYVIKNTETGKSIYIEVKRQDGWVEGKPRSAGRGNAHERSCKYFTPGLQKILRDEAKIKEGILPFWTVFLGDITRDPCRVREINCWYNGYEAHFFLWRDNTNSLPLIEHFLENIKPIID